MAENGNKRRVYIVDMETNTPIVGETSNTFTLGSDLIEVSDKTTEWADFIAGKKNWNATVQVNLDNTAEAKQIDFVKALTAGKKVKVFIGTLNVSAQSDGFSGEALVASVEETSDNHAVVSRSISLTGCGEATIVAAE